jgi:hypothetical protein
MPDAAPGVRAATLAVDGALDWRRLILVGMVPLKFLLAWVLAEQLLPRERPSDDAHPSRPLSGRRGVDYWLEKNGA